jgi:hypothetical protein
MPDGRTAPLNLTELVTVMNEIAPAILAMDAGDPRRASFTKASVNSSAKFARPSAHMLAMIDQRIDELSDETATLTIGEPRRTSTLTRAASRFEG